MWFELAVALVFFAAGTGVAAVGARRTVRQIAHTALFSAASLVAGGVYAGLAFEPEGLAVGRLGVDLRTVGWALTTPLLLAGVAMAAVPFQTASRRSGGRPHPSEGVAATVAALVLVDLAMIGCAAVAAETEGATQAIWLAAGLAAFGALVWILFGPLKTISEEGHPLRSETYFRHAAILTAIWALYPVILMLSPAGWGWAGAGFAVVLFALLDLAAKAGFGLYAVLDSLRLAEIEVQDRPLPIEPGHARTRQRRATGRPAAAKGTHATLGRVSSGIRPLSADRAEPADCDARVVRPGPVPGGQGRGALAVMRTRSGRPLALARIVPRRRTTVADEPKAEVGTSAPPADEPEADGEDDRRAAAEAAARPSFAAAMKFAMERRAAMDAVARQLGPRVDDLRSALARPTPHGTHGSELSPRRAPTRRVFAARRPRPRRDREASEAPDTAGAAPSRAAPPRRPDTAADRARARRRLVPGPNRETLIAAAASLAVLRAVRRRRGAGGDQHTP